MPTNPYDIGTIVSDIELELIKSMRRNLAGHRAWEAAEGFDWPQWQSEKMQALEGFRRRNAAIMAERSPLVDEEVRKAIEAQYKEGKSLVERSIQRAQRYGHTPMRDPYTSGFFGVNDRKVEALIQSATADVRQAEVAALRMSDDVYRQTIYKAQMAASTGAVTVNQAVDIATRDFLARGINAIQYRDGRRVGIDSYSEMAIRTANRRATLMGQGSMMVEWGESLVYVSQYGASSPICLPWQGRVYVDDVYAAGKAQDYGGKYPLLSEAIASGLFHPNCRHRSSPYFEDVNDAPARMDEEETAEHYELEQEQRHNERQIRKYKRLEAGSLDPDNKEKYGRKVDEWQTRQRELIAENPKVLRRDYAREQTRGVGLPAKGDAPPSPSMEQTYAQRAKTVLENSKGSVYNRDRLLEAADAVPLVVQDDLPLPMGYDFDTRQILVNPKHPGFADISAEDAYIHELSHHLDMTQYKSYDSMTYSDALNRAAMRMEVSPERIAEIEELLKSKYAEEGFLHDIIDGANQQRITTLYGHNNDYWDMMGRRELETFANLSTLDVRGRLGEILQDIPELSELADVFKNLVGGAI